MQQFQLHYDPAARLLPRGPLFFSLLLASAALLLLTGHWMLLVLVTCLGLALWHRLQVVEQAIPPQLPGANRLKPVDGGISSGQPLTAHRSTRRAVVSDGGSFERAL
ncbi:MAG: hypothetical protein OQL28_05665 [Sedimenticola sp.]|nr:hypothetical protein [Sedimenticola sp.]